MIAKFIEWFVYSSKNPQALALTVRGLLVGAIPTAVFLLQLSGITDIGTVELQQIIDVVEKAILYGFGFIASVMTIWGFARKVFITVRKALGWE